MTVLASIFTSLVVKKRDASFFHDLNLAAVSRVYRACMVSGETWMYIFRSDCWTENKNKRKSTSFSRLTRSDLYRQGFDLKKIGRPLCETLAVTISVR